MRQVPIALLLVLALALPATASPPAGGPFDVDAMVADIGHYIALGPEHHHTGTPPGRRAEEWVAGELEHAGFEVSAQPFTFLAFHPREVSLTVAGAPLPAYELPYSGVTGPQGVTAELVDVGRGSPFELAFTDIAGRIAVVEVPSLQRNVTVTLERVYADLVEADAAGAVFVIEGPGDEPPLQNMDSTGGVHGAPAVVVGMHSGARVRAAAGEEATIVLRARVADSCTRNVVGILPGQSERIVVVATPLHAHTPAATERGPGLAGLLALARHYGSLPISERPVTLAFVGVAGHEVGMLGMTMLLEAEWFGSAEAFVHLGASLAVRSAAEVGGEMVVAPAPEFSRVLSLSENPLLDPVRPHFAEAGLVTTAPPAVAMPGGSNHAYAAGVPTVSVAGSSAVYHTRADTIEWVDPDLLGPIVEAFRESIDHIVGLPAGALRDANLVAVTAGSDRGYATHPLAPTVEDPPHPPTPGCS
jgi:hypothetical protein